MFAREGTHRGSVYRRSAASSQVLFLLERSLTYHCAWHLRLTEGWMPFHLSLRLGLLLLSFPRAARGYLLSLLSFARLGTLFVWSLVLFPKSFSSLHLLREDRKLLFLSPCGHHLRGGALFPRASGRRSLERAPWPCSAGEVTWFAGPISSRLFRVGTSCDSCSRPCICCPGASWSAGNTRRIPRFAVRPVSGIGGVLPAES